MREILFRGKRTDNGEWLEGWYQPPVEVTHCDGRKESLGASLSVIGQDGFLEDVYIIPETLGQFTGLTDKNGKKMFEGDVVKFTGSPFGYSYTGVVCFNEGSFCIKYKLWRKEGFHRIGQTTQWQDMGASGIVTYQYEILGNIHDNPELLEVTDNA